MRDNADVAENRADTWVGPYTTVEITSMLILNFKTAPDTTKVCYCNDVTLGEIRAAIKDGAKSVDEIREATGACTGNRCEELNPSGGCCESDIIGILAACTGSKGPSGKCKCCG